MAKKSRQPVRPWAALAVITTLSVVFGLQFIRILLPAFRYYLRDTLGIGSLTLAPIALGVFALGLLAILILRLFGGRAAFGFATVGLALLRLFAQFSTQAALDLILSAAGITLFVVFLVYALGLARHNGSREQLAFFILFGVALDTGLHTAGGTLDLVWQFDTLPILAVLILAFALVLAYRIALSNGSVAELNEVGWRQAWPVLAIGPWIFLQMLIFQNVARTAANSGLSLPLAAGVVALGNLAGLAVVLWGARTGWRSSWADSRLGVLLVLAVLPLDSIPLLGVAAALIGQVVSFLLLALIFLNQAEGEPSRALARTTVWVVAGMEILVLCSFLYYASYDIPLGFKAPVVPLVAGILVAAAVWAAGRRRMERAWGKTRLTPSLLWLGALLLVFPALLLLGWQTPAAQPPAGGSPLRVMTYNLLQGYNTSGRMNIEAQAQLIEGNRPDIIAFQEVSRGYLINGSIDMIEWLSRRLGMPYVYGPTADPLWGNALLSRYPIVSSSLQALPPDDLLLQRGYIDAQIAVGSETVRVIATHLHHPMDGSTVRQSQVQSVLDAWDGTPRTIFLGDLNARPGDPEMVMLSVGGFSDSLAGVSPPGNYTYYSPDPYEQIDYIWLTPDFNLQDAFVPQSTVSDHLPVVVQVE